MIDKVAEFDDEVMEKYLEGKSQLKKSFINVLKLVLTLFN